MRDEHRDGQFLATLLTLAGTTPAQDLLVGRVRVRLHGLAEELAAPLRHALVDADDQPPLATLHHVAGPAPAPPWSSADCLLRDQVRGRTSGRFRALYRPDVPALHLADLETGTGVLWHRSPDELPARETSSPFTPLLSWFLAGAGLRMTHGAVVGHEHGGVLLAGPSGAGKTTTTLACVRAGMLTGGEDYVVVDLRRREGLAVYDAAKLGAFTLDRFPEAAGHVVGTSEQGKAVVALSDVFPGSLVPRLPLRAVVVPVVAARTAARPRPIAPGVALRALSASNLVQLAGDDARTLQQLAELSRTLPCFALEVGPDLESIAPALETVIDETEAA